MIKKRFAFGMLAITLVLGMVLVSCDDGDGGGPTINNTNGTLTVSGIPEKYNGKWISGEGMLGSTELLAYTAITATSSTGALISNGTAILKVWKFNEANISVDNFDGSGTSSSFEFVILSKATPTSMDDIIAIHNSYATATFTSGTGTCNIGALTWIE